LNDIDRQQANADHADRDTETRRAEDALLSLLGYEEHNGSWLTPEGLRLDGGRAEALEEACSEVELGHVAIRRPREAAEHRDVPRRARRVRRCRSLAA
jgi:hypothetical protein